MNVIYAPKGRAAEYGELAVNLYRHCGHGCLACYVPEMFHMTLKEFNEPATLRPGIIEKLAKDAWQLGAARDQREIVMSFTCDPYPPGDTSPTRRAIEIFIKNDLRFTILSKGGTRSTSDFDLMAGYKYGCRYGASLTLSNPKLSAIYEPGAAPPENRLNALFQASQAGIPTWASCEPVLFTDESLKIIKRAIPYVDEFRIGAVNHVKTLQERIPGYEPPTRLEMVEFVHGVLDALKGTNKRHIWKESMRPYLDAAGVRG